MININKIEFRQTERAIKRLQYVNEYPVARFIDKFGNIVYNSYAICHDCYLLRLNRVQAVCAKWQCYSCCCGQTAGGHCVL